jgi:hypothetical protein
MIMEIPQRITCFISMKSEILSDYPGALSDYPGALSDYAAP